MISNGSSNRLNDNHVRAQMQGALRPLDGTTENNPLGSFERTVELDAG